ncbi:MAG: hypothetical protein JRJ85_08455, partial [Deltaproteobacteria bacterium]|nr:hypothetical protein [Deltaproteobacteria bacterium]
ILENALRQAIILGGGTIKLFFAFPVSIVLLRITAIVVVQVVSRDTQEEVLRPQVLIRESAIKAMPTTSLPIYNQYPFLPG